MNTVLFLHGLEGRPDGTKPNALRTAGFHVVAPDGRGLPLAERVRGALAGLDANPGALLVGSSYGGLAAAWVASRRPSDLRGLVLLAPALHHRESPVDDPAALGVPSTLPVTIVHATADAVVPVAASRAFAQRHPHVVLVEVDDAHDLRRSLDAILAAVRSHVG